MQLQPQRIRIWRRCPETCAPPPTTRRTSGSDVEAARQQLLTVLERSSDRALQVRRPGRAAAAVGTQARAARPQRLGALRMPVDLSAGPADAQAYMCARVDHRGPVEQGRRGEQAAEPAGRAAAGTGQARLELQAARDRGPGSPLACRGAQPAHCQPALRPSVFSITLRRRWARQWGYSRPESSIASATRPPWPQRQRRCPSGRCPPSRRPRPPRSTPWWR